MALKRLTNEELVEKCKEIFYKYMSSSPTFYYKGSNIDCSEECPTPVDMAHEMILKNIQDMKERIELYNEVINEPAKSHEDKENNRLIQEQVGYLKEVIEIQQNSCIKTQKERQARGRLNKNDGLEPYSCSSLRIPLNKYINSFYDDFILEVVFFDDVTTLNGLYDEYRKLQTTEERFNFIKQNTEITHMTLIILANTGYHLASVELLGNINYTDSRVKSGMIIILSKKYANFNDLTLADTMQMKNNDLRQLFQSKIDLDKEDMELMAEKNIRGDNYKILKSSHDLWIRYVCPSTGRVYYNILVPKNLKISEYFEEDNYESYINSWWNITHMGEPIEGKPIIRC